MNIYNEAHKLAKSIKESDEYKEYVTKKKVAFADSKNKEMIEDFRKKTLDIQMQQMSGKEVDKEKIEKVKKLEEILTLNSQIKDYFLAEMRFSQVISDIYKILEDAIKVVTEDTEK